MQIVAALWIDNINFRQEFQGGPTKIDITGVYFSTSFEAYPTTLQPHLVVLVRAESDDARHGTVEVVCRAESDQRVLSQWRQPVSIQPPGRFFYQLVRPELTIEEPGVIEAVCTIPETGSTIVVPLTLMP